MNLSGVQKVDNIKEEIGLCLGDRLSSFGSKSSLMPIYNKLLCVYGSGRDVMIELNWFIE